MFRIFFVLALVACAAVAAHAQTDDLHLNREILAGDCTLYKKIVDTYSAEEVKEDKFNVVETWKEKLALCKEALNYLDQALQSLDHTLASCAKAKPTQATQPAPVQKAEVREEKRVQIRRPARRIRLKRPRLYRVPPQGPPVLFLKQP